MRFLGKLFLLAFVLLFGLLSAGAVAVLLIRVCTVAPTARHGAFMARTSFTYLGLVSPVILLGVLLLIGLVTWRLLAGNASRKPERGSEEESRIMQELHHGLSRLDERVEALETILLDRAAADRANRGGSQSI